uniref:Uncharacterized protein n=1 Tax=Picea sitchensis TaxID=3332 RepID=A9NU43_PICSI|nr:unknown [Picea sitchensis]
MKTRNTSQKQKVKVTNSIRKLMQERMQNLKIIKNSLTCCKQGRQLASRIV